MPIPVAILSDKGDLKNVASFFQDSEFEIFSITSGDDQTCSFMMALQEGKRRAPSSPLIIIKDTSSSYYSAKDIALVLKQEMKADLIYLTRWEDRCDLSTPEATIPLQNTFIQTVNIHAPRGYQAIMISPALRDSLRKKKKLDDTVENTLYSLVHSGRVTAIGYNPNLFVYDVKYAKEMTDYYRANLCTAVKPPIDSTKQITVETYIYLTIIVGFFLLVAYGLYLLGPVPKSYSSPLTLERDSYNTVK